MSAKPKLSLQDRVVAAAEANLAEERAVCAVDVLLRIGWLDPSWEKRWRQLQVPTLEESMQTNPARITQALLHLRRWAETKALVAKEAEYLAKTPARQALRFSRSGDPALERLYRTHWVASDVPQARRERIVEKASTPDIVAVIPSRSDWACHRCGGTGDFLVMENAGPACLACVGLVDLVFVPAGNALLSRRVKAGSGRCAVVVRFSKTRRRYERQGLLVEPEVLARIQAELGQRDPAG